MESNFLKSIEGHTKGPFKVGKAFPSIDKNTIYPVLINGQTCDSCGNNSGQYLVCHTFKNALPKGQSKANAKLLSKSYLLPDIYKLLEYVSDDIMVNEIPAAMHNWAKQLLDKLNS